MAGTIRSPSYTLVEPYETAAGRMLHMDCYRLSDAEELEMLGLRDAPPESALWLVEWPERAGNALPVADIDLHLLLAGEGRRVRLGGPENGQLGEVLQSML